MDKQTLRQILREELKGYATTDDIKKSATKVTEDLTEVIKEFADELDEKKADKAQTLPLEVRVESLEGKILPQ